MRVLFILQMLIWSMPLAASVNLRNPSTTIRKENQELPIIYTFFHVKIKEDLKEDNLLEHENMLAAWSAAWSERGWNPIVLTLDDAKKHPDYDYYNDKFIYATPEDAYIYRGSYNHMCLMRWLAVTAQQRDVFMSDYDTFPMSIRTQQGIHLPNNGNFTVYEGHVPSLMSGSVSEWERMAEAVFEKIFQKFDEGGQKEVYSDMYALQDVYMTSPRRNRAYILRKQVDNYPYSGKRKLDCDRTNKALALHLSHSDTHIARDAGLIPTFRKRGDRYRYSEMVLSDWKRQCSPDVQAN